jgi:lysophospholipase L1-like esterase
MRIAESIPNVRQLLVGFAAVSALPMFVLGDSLVAIAKGWRTGSRLDWLVIIAAALMLVTACWVVSRKSGRLFIASRAVPLAVCLVTTLGTWLAAESFFSAFAAPAASVHWHLRPPGLVTVFAPAPDVMPGIYGESRFTVNSLGIRGPELPPRDAAYRIVCIGGSTTECLYLDDTEAWPYLVMEKVNERPNANSTWVGNIGVSGYSTVEHLQFMTEDNLWKEIDCAVFLVGANDLGRFLRFGIARKWPSESRRDRERELRLLQPIWRQSVVLEATRNIIREWNRPSIVIEDQTGSNYVVRRQMRQNGIIREDTPDLTKALDQYADRITRLVKLCQAAGVRPVFVTQPTLMSDDAPVEVTQMFWGGDDGQGGYFQVEKLGKGLQQYNRRLENVCEREHVLCIDLATVNHHAEFFYDEYHFNEVGARAVAGLVAEGLERDGRW